MSRTKINVTAVIDAKRNVNSAKSNIINVRSQFSQTKNSIDSKIKNRANIRNRLNTVQNQLLNIDNKISRIGSTVQSGVNRFDKTDRTINAWRIGNINSIGKISSWTSKGINPNNYSVWAEYKKSDGIFGATTAGFTDGTSKEEYSLEGSLKSEGGFDGINDKFKKWKEKQEEKLKDKGLFDEDKDTEYFDKNGKPIKEKDAPDFYERDATVAEFKVEGKKSVALVDKEYENVLGGTATVTVAEAEAHGSLAAGLYVIGKDGEQIFSPGVSAEVGVSVTGFNATYENQLIGNDMIGVNVDGSVTALSASATAEANINFLGKDKNGNIAFDPQVNVGVNAEAVLVEAEASAGVNVLGGEVEVKGSVKVGVGAHADVGYKDGVFKCDIGASLGVGFDVGFEVDVGGMVNTVADAASSAWEDIKSGWKSLW